VHVDEYGRIQLPTASSLGRRPAGMFPPTPRCGASTASDAPLGFRRGHDMGVLDDERFRDVHFPYSPFASSRRCPRAPGRPVVKDADHGSSFSLSSRRLSIRSPGFPSRDAGARREEEAGFPDDGPGDVDALLLAAAERGGICVVQPRRIRSRTRSAAARRRAAPASTGPEKAVRRPRPTAATGDTGKLGDVAHLAVADPETACSPRRARSTFRRTDANHTSPTRGVGSRRCT
jgi:hypothetical protein